jgi:formylmethanofuran dehydrogenase subunit C
LKLVEEAIKDISVHGDAEWFLSDDRYSGCEYDEDGRPIYPEEAEFHSQ